jgi:isopropylmalate/homocitrate/citramalate synthase
MMTDDKLWWTSEFNSDPEILGENNLPEKLKIYDTTLRDGEQTIGVSFDKNEKLRIAQELDRLGVDRIEAGMPVVSKEDKEAAELIVNAGLKAEIWGFCRSIRGDIDACAQVGIKHVICEIATSDIKMHAYNITRDQVLKKALDAVQHAKSLGMYTAFFAVDSTRADIKFLETIFRKVADEGQADEMVIVDTLGVATPETMYSLTKKLKDWVDLPIMTHCHNDFGMAVSCSLFSVKGGANCAHVTINGLGEKTGNTDLAELALAAKLYGMNTNIDMKKLYDVSKLVEQYSGIAISPLKPVVGENVFQRESGVTVAQLISYPPAVEGYSPEVVGRQRGVLLSKKSGKKSIEYKLKEMNMSIAAEQIDNLVQKIKELGSKKKGLVTDDEFKQIVNGF